MDKHEHVIPDLLRLDEALSEVGIGNPPFYHIA